MCHVSTNYHLSTSSFFFFLLHFSFILPPFYTLYPSILLPLPFLYRILTGCGVAAVFGLALALVADTIPDRTRAPALGLLQSLSTWGNILAGPRRHGVGALAVRQMLPFGLKPWQALFLIGALPAFMCVFMLRRLPEPARWVKARDAGLKAGVKFGSYSALLVSSRWSRNAWLGLIACSAGIIGLWGSATSARRLSARFVSSHLALTTTTPNELASQQAYWRALGLLFQNMGGFAGMMTLAWVAQRWGRRPALGIALLLSFFSTLLVFKYLREFSQIYWMLPADGLSASCRSSRSTQSTYPNFFPRACAAQARASATMAAASWQLRRHSPSAVLPPTWVVMWKTFALRACG
jgi:MFS family permease